MKKIIWKIGRCVYSVSVLTPFIVIGVISMKNLYNAEMYLLLFLSVCYTYYYIKENEKQENIKNSLENYIKSYNYKNKYFAKIFDTLNDEAKMRLIQEDLKKLYEIIKK